MMRRLLSAVVGLLGGAVALSAQSVAPGKEVRMSPDAIAFLDAMAKRTVTTHAEQAACVTGYAMRDSTLLIATIGPAQHVTKTDSVTVYSTGDTCAWWQPSVHTHVVDNGWLDSPSPIDQHTAAVRGVWSFLVSVRPDSSWKLRVYP